MNPLILDSQQNSYSDEEFQKYIFHLCEEHKRDGRALAFAFIIYDFSNPYISKVLKDNDFLSALDKTAGRYLTIFFIDSRDAHFQRTQRQSQIRDMKRGHSMPPGFIGYLAPVIVSKTQVEKAMEQISSTLGFEERLDTPSVLFFQTDGDTISDYFAVSLTSDHTEDAFNELHSHIQNAVDSIKLVKPEYSGNGSEIFNLVREGVKKGRFVKFIKLKVLKRISIGAVIAVGKLILG